MVLEWFLHYFSETRNIQHTGHPLHQQPAHLLGITIVEQQFHKASELKTLYHPRVQLKKPPETKLKPVQHLRPGGYIRCKQDASENHHIDITFVTRVTARC
jgi:hypothetical protein